jgi:DNA-binding PadR family transcriptional regulator
MPKPQPAKLNTLGYALLGILARGDGSGYDIAQGLKDPVAFFWHAQHSQIYPELAKLEVSKLVQHTLIEQSERPDKKVYRLTPKGKKVLKTWLEAATDVPKHRDELVLKAYTIWLSDPQTAAQLMQDHAQVHADRLKDFEGRLERLHSKAGTDTIRLDSPWFGILAVLKRGIGFEREYLEWCEWMLRCLSKAE